MKHNIYIKILIYSSILAFIMFSCRMIYVQGFSNLEKFKHIIQPSYKTDTLFFNKALFCPIFYDGTIRNSETNTKGLYYNDSLLNFDSISSYIYKGMSSLGITVKLNNLQNKPINQCLATFRKKLYKYNIVDDDSIVQLTNLGKDKTYFIPIFIGRSGIFRGDYGINYRTGFNLKICLIKNRKVIYSKYFTTKKKSEIFTLDDAKDYESTREFFELNNHTPVFTQEDWNRIMAFAMKGYLKRLKK